MQLSKSLLTLLMGFTMASAIALPVPAEAAVAADKKDGNKGSTKAKAADCANAKKLAAGIDDNIKVQEEEQKNVAAIKKIVSSNNPDKAQFDSAKKTLLSTVEKGIKIREDNEKLAKGNGAADGLKTVAQAQQTELKQSKSLKGTKDDMSTIAQLEKEFAGGIDQNKKNKAAALKGC
ncbi:hypothetical protein CSOJ01_05930 [Colletotrichum sojae]|uniref:Small secreted protein n=1 Tax=Colletotrichum sojae TaxID=2175907 RepID=A0A8H6JEL7_9PEZI|nr:hypothetical protein CSOJ01_05930 [Colletotrichum sojae]